MYYNYKKLARTFSKRMHFKNL